MAVYPEMAAEDFFDGFPESRQLMDALVGMLDAIGPYVLRVGKSQIAICREMPFAWAWMPGKYLHGKTAPLVLSIAFQEKDASPRWKEVAQVSKKRYMHHLELNRVDDLDDEVAAWLRAAWASAEENERISRKKDQ